jgi:hypothetical protein
MAGLGRQKLGMLHELPRLVGEEAAMKIFEHYGGRSVVFPQYENDNPQGARKFRELADLVGRETALVVIGAIGGQEVYMPKAVHKEREARNAAICAEYDAGKSVAQLVREYKLSDRQIESILKQV